MNRNISIYRIRKGVPGVGRRLARHFDCNELTSLKPTLAIQPNSLVINYGRSTVPAWWVNAQADGVRVLNHPRAVKASTNKVECLQMLSDAGVAVLESTTDGAVAVGWLRNYGEESDVIVRHTATGKRGDGIELVKVGAVEGAIDYSAPLYTKFYDKTHEFRVHVVNGEIIDYAQKKKMGKKKREARGIDEVDMISRNHKKGWIFARKDIYDFDVIRQLGLDATRVVGLDICAVDILAKISDDGELIHAVVCETNSAPGMSDKNTFNAYTKAFEKCLEEM